MHYPKYLTPGDISYARDFFGKYQNYTLEDFMSRWDCSLRDVATITGASLETVRSWRKKKYTPNPSSMVLLAIADHVMEKRREKIERSNFSRCQ